MTDHERKGVYKRELLRCGDGWLLVELRKNGRIVSKEFIADYDEAVVAFSMASRHITPRS